MPNCHLPSSERPFLVDSRNNFHRYPVKSISSGESSIRRTFADINYIVSVDGNGSAGITGEANDKEWNDRQQHNFIGTKGVEKVLQSGMKFSRGTRRVIMAWHATTKGDLYVRYWIIDGRRVLGYSCAGCIDNLTSDEWYFSPCTRQGRFSPQFFPPSRAFNPPKCSFSLDN